MAAVAPSCADFLAFFIAFLLNQAPRRRPAAGWWRGTGPPLVTGRLGHPHSDHIYSCPYTHLFLLPLSRGLPVCIAGGNKVMSFGTHNQQSSNCSSHTHRYSAAGECEKCSCFTQDSHLSYPQSVHSTTAAPWESVSHLHSAITYYVTLFTLYSAVLYA